MSMSVNICNLIGNILIIQTETGKGGEKLSFSQGRSK